MYLCPYVTDRYLIDVDEIYHSCKIKVIKKIKWIKTIKYNTKYLCSEQFFSSFKWVPWVSVSQWYHKPTFFTLFRYSTLNMMWHVLQDWCSLAADMYWKYKWTKYLKEPTILTGPDGILYLIQWLNTLAFRIRAFLWTPKNVRGCLVRPHRNNFKVSAAVSPIGKQLSYKIKYINLQNIYNFSLDKFMTKDRK